MYFYFDLGNVLMHFDPQRACGNLARLSGCSAEDVRRVVYDSGLELRYEAGELTSEQFASEVAGRLEIRCDAPRLIAALSDMFTPNLAIRPVLEALRTAGIPLGILSNTCEGHWEWIERQRCEPLHGGRWDCVALSFRLRCLKPNPEIYQRAAELAGCDETQLWFTDDRPENVAAARQRGWNALLYEGPERLLRDLNASLLSEVPARLPTGSSPCN